jgi:hypothetical protein
VVVGALLVAFLLPGAALLPAASATSDPTSERVLHYLSFTPAEQDALRRGEITSHAVNELSDKELAITMAMLVPTKVADLLDFLRSGKALETDRDSLAHGVIPIDASGHFDEAALAGVVLDPSEGKEVRNLLESGPGSSYNLSDAELRTFADLRRTFPAKERGKDPRCAEAVVSAYRKVLRDRLAAYLDRGLSGVDPYVRDGETRADPADELRKAAGAARFLEQWYPQVFAAFLDFPKADQSGIENRFLWLKQTVQDRPTFILSHRTLCIRDGIAVAAERQFYVGHSYNSLQILVGLVPMEGKTLVVYLNRTSSDQVAGVLTGTRHGVGRHIMEKEIRGQFEDVRAKLAGGP